MNETTDRPYSRYEMSVPGTWSPAYATRPVTVYGVREGESPEVVAKGTCRLRKTGEPVSVAVPGFRPGFDWDKLNNGQGPGEWVASATPTEN